MSGALIEELQYATGEAQKRKKKISKKKKDMKEDIMEYNWKEIESLR